MTFSSKAYNARLRPSLGLRKAFYPNRPFQQKSTATRPGIEHDNAFSRERTSLGFKRLSDDERESQLSKNNDQDHLPGVLDAPAQSLEHDDRRVYLQFYPLHKTLFPTKYLSLSNEDRVNIWSSQRVDFLSSLKHIPATAPFKTRVQIASSILDKGLSSNGESHNFSKYLPHICTAIWSRGSLKERRWALRTFNSIVARVKGEGISITPDILATGVAFFASARSASSSAIYAKLCPEISEGVAYSRVLLAFRELKAWAESEQAWESGATWTKQQVLDSLKSWVLSSSVNSLLFKTIWERSLITSSSRACTYFVDTLSAFGGAQALSDAWDDLTAGPDWSSCATSDHSRILNRRRIIALCFIRGYLKLERGDIAWGIVREAGIHPQDLSIAEWNGLFKHPEHISRVTGNMQATLLEVLDIQLTEVERLFGVRWAGKEDGHHIDEHEVQERSSTEMEGDYDTLEKEWS